jgi:hypothetical protein
MECRVRPAMFLTLTTAQGCRPASSATRASTTNAFSAAHVKRASTSRRSGTWNDDDYDVLANGAVVGRIFEANAAPVGLPWMWTLA